MSIDEIEKTTPGSRHGSRGAGDFLKALSREIRGVEHESYTIGHLESPEDIDAARKLATQGFKDLEKIPEEAVDEETGLPKKDVLHDSSTYFGIKDEQGNMVATVRYFWRPDSKITDSRMPLDQLPPDSAAMLNGRRPGAIAEIGNLFKRPGVSHIDMMLMLAEMIGEANSKGIESFTTGLEPNVYERSFRDVFGGSLKILSPHTVTFPGVIGEQVPLMINIPTVVRNQVFGRFKDKSVAAVNMDVAPRPEKTAKQEMSKTIMRLAAAALFSLRMKRAEKRESHSD